MMVGRWITGNMPPTNNYVCRRLLIPNDLALVMAVDGALLPLLDNWRWEQIEGTLTPDETVVLLAKMYHEFLDSACMIGMIAPYATTNPPSGCLPCDGTIYQRVDYPNLYELIDMAHVVDADQFRTPDLRDTFVLAAGATNATNTTGGAASVALTASQNGQHSHVANPHGHTTQPHTHTEITALPAVASILPPPDIIPSAVPSAAVTGLATVIVDATVTTIQDSGTGAAHENMPPFHALQYCIVAR